MLNRLGFFALVAPLACQDQAAAPEAEYTQRFTYPVPSIDLLLVVGTSSDAAPAEVSASLPALTHLMAEKRASLRTAVVRADAPTVPACSAPASVSPDEIATCLTSLGIADPPGDELDALRVALSCEGPLRAALVPCGGTDFLRPEATLLVVMVTEATCERPEAGSVEDTWRFLMSQKPEPLTSIALVAMGGCRTRELADLLAENGVACPGGEPSVCQDTAAAVASLFDAVDAMGALCLEEAPEPGSVRVEVDGRTNAAWHVETDEQCASGVAVRGPLPLPGSEVVVRYQVR